MSFFDDIYDRLFPKEESAPKIAQQLIKRSQTYLTEYQRWSDSPNRTQQVDQLMRGYHYKKMRIQSSYDVHLLTSSMANGFALSYNVDISKQHFQFIFDYLADRVKVLDYKLANSDITITDKPDFIETKEKHYLKPLVGSGQLLNQQYGNVLIEHVLINEKPSYLKLVANTYSDRNYSNPLDFDELLEHLFQGRVD